jgi:hypothetical protein
LAGAGITTSIAARLGYINTVYVGKFLREACEELALGQFGELNGKRAAA